MLKYAPVIQEIRKIKKEYKKSKDRLLKEFPNIIDRYALREETIEAQERLFRRNGKSARDCSTQFEKRKHFEFAESESTEDPEQPHSYKYRKELDELKKKLQNLQSF